MDFDAFPEIEDFHRLPKKVVVKGGVSKTHEKGSELSGLIINNTGQPIKNLKVNLVIFNEKDMPILNAIVEPNATQLEQGGMSSFLFRLESYQKEITNYYLYPNWSYDDSNWG